MARRRRFRRSSPELRLYFLAFFMLLAFGLVAAKLWWEQVARGPLWSQKIASRSEVTVRVPSVRGEIRDRHGLTLVGNRASYEVDFYLPDMVRGFKQQVDAAGHKIRVPQTTYTATIRQMMKVMKEDDVVQIVNSSIIPRLQQLDLAKDYNAERLQKHYHNDTEVPFPYLEEIDFKTIAKFSEHNVGLPGVDISVRPVRQYVYGALAAHLLGYVGAPVNINALPDVAKYNFYQPDVEGKSQIEASMDKYLRGEPGERVLQRNVKGVIESEVRNDPPTPGANVYLTLDARIQTIVEQALRHPSIGRAAAVVVDPNTGEVLAMASVPSFDPNIFIPSISVQDWEALKKDPAKPTENRAVSGYPPGSTFKIITSLAGLTKNLDKDHENCPGGIDIDDHYFHCWISEKHGSHGMLGLTDALKVSCDCFFYQYGIKASIDAIDHVGALMGIGQHSNLGLANEEGVLPGKEWLSRAHPQEKWSRAQTANASIGQGYVLASPLQMAMAYATVANGGISYEPRVIKKVLDQNGRDVRDENNEIAVPDRPKIRADLHNELTQQQIDLVRQGLWKVVNESGGTGSAGRVKNVVVAGKTGTAQWADRGIKDYIAWFCCFAPFDHPRYAIAVMVQSGKHGGGVAAPVAQHILEQCVAMDQGNFKVEVAKLTPAHSDHPFQPIEKLPDYKNGTAVTVNAEEETAGDKPAAERSQSSHGKDAHPDLRPEADARGRVQRAQQAQPQPPPAGSPRLPRALLQAAIRAPTRPRAFRVIPVEKMRPGCGLACIFPMPFPEPFHFTDFPQQPPLTPPQCFPIFTQNFFP